MTSDFIQVKGDIPDNVVVAGVPAKIIKHLKPFTPIEYPTDLVSLYKGVTAAKNGNANGTGDGVSNDTTNGSQIEAENTSTADA